MSQLELTSTASTGEDRESTKHSLTTKMAWPDILYNGLVHVFTVGFTLFITNLSFANGITLFSWHPSLMSLGFFTLMAEAILCFTEKNIPTINLKYQRKVDIHWILQMIAAISITFGFASIFGNKIIKNKQHFTTTHSIIGLTSVIFLFATMLGGIATKYSFSIKHIIRPQYTKLLHSAAGLVNFTMGSVAVILGLYSNWFQKHANNFSFYFCFTLVLFVLQHIVFRSSLHLYSRLKRIYR